MAEETEIKRKFDLWDMEFDEVSLVPSGDNPHANIVLSKAAYITHQTGRRSGGGRHHQDGWRHTKHVFKDKGDGTCRLCDEEAKYSFHKSDGLDPDAWNEINKRDFTAEQRRELASKGQAMPDGSYPTPTLGDLNRAIQSWGRVGANSRASLKRYLLRRARALNASQDVIDRINNLSLSKSEPITLSAWIATNIATNTQPETAAEFVKFYGRPDNKPDNKPVSKKVDRRTLRKVTLRDARGRILKSRI